jgi:hypothetical protein
VAWGNYDNDRHLDILLSGQAGTGPFTKVYQGIASGGSRTWVDANIALPQLTNSSVAWGYNNVDGYLDLLVAGTDQANNGVLKIYKNIKNPDSTRGFQAISTPGLTVVPTTSCVWNNFDKTKDLDIAFIGVGNSNTSVYERLDNGNYQLFDDASLVDLKDGSVAWADYDNDGDMDLLVTGQDNSSTLYCRLYRHESSSKTFTFVEAFEGVRYSSVAWGDYDNNGDLDLFFAGDGGNGPLVRLYKNNHPSTNTPPTVPTNLSVGISAVNDEITLTWDKSSDDQTTAQNILTYNVMVGKNSGGFDIVSPLSVPDTGKRMLPAVGNAGTNNSYIIKYSSLSAGDYYWRVQAIDNVYAGSAFSSEGIFTKSGSAKIAGADSVAEEENAVSEAPAAIPQEFALSQNYPNPFNPSTRLNLNLPENGYVTAVVYDLKGQEVVRLRDAYMTAGYNFLDWDGRNAAGAVVSSGTYIVKVRFEGASGVRKDVSSRILLLK